MEQNIQLKGVISETEKKSLLEKSKVFLHLAYFEPLVPVITILEALSYGVPTIIYDMKTIDDYPQLRKTPALIICQNKAVDSVAREVIRVTKMKPNEREKLKHASRLIASQYTWDEIVKTQIAVFDTVHAEF